jgi:hypothetical protein
VIYPPDETPIRTWYALDRIEDVSKVSGTGRVAYVLPITGAGVVTVWDTSFVDEDGVQRHSRGSEYLPDLAMFRTIHCYGGRSLLTPLDPVDEAAIAQAERLLADACSRWDIVLLVLAGQRKGTAQ